MINYDSIFKSRLIFVYRRLPKLSYTPFWLRQNGVERTVHQRFWHFQCSLILVVLRKPALFRKFLILFTNVKSARPVPPLVDRSFNLVLAKPERGVS